MDQPDNDAIAAPSANPPEQPTPIATQDNVTKQDGPNTKPTKELMDRVLDFLSTSSNETLLGVFALLMLGTYIILGRVGLLLIGVSLGVVLHASWEGTSHRGGNEETSSRKRKELALEVSHRLLDWPQRLASATATATADSKPDSGSLATSPENLSDEDLEYLTFRPATAAALRLLTDTVIKDYVKYWYKPILPNDIIFPTSCRRTLTYFVTAVSSHLSHKRTEDTFLQFLTNSSSIIIVFFNELAAAFTATGSSPHEAKQIVDQYLENSPDSSLANVLSEEQQRKKLSMIADDILSNYLDANSYRCSPVRDFLREIFAGVVLESTVTSLSRPEFINDWIIYLLQDGESELMHAIDAGVEGARNQGVGAGAGASKAQTPETIKTPAEPKQENTAERKSESTDRATEEALLEAKRLSALIASHDEQIVPSDQSIHSDRPERTSILAETDIEQPNTTTNPHEQSSAAIASHGPTGSFEQPTPAPAVAAPRQSGEDAPAPMSLHGAQVLVDDDSAATEKGPIKSRPTWDYLLQVEPTSTRSSGWMVFRKYADFQSLHEMLETVSRLNNIQSFSSRFPALPPWKGKTRQELAHDLERYIQEAVRHESLADTDRMRRFLEKEVNPSEKNTPKSGFSFPSQSAFENMGKGMLGALTNAPKGVAGGGRAMFDGVTGVFGGGHNRKPTISADRQSTHQKSPSKTERDLALTPKEGSGSVSDLGRANSSPVGLNIDARSTSARSSEEDRPRVSSSSTSLSLDAWKEDKPQSPAPSDFDSNANPTKIEQNAWASGSTLASSGDVNSSTSTDRVRVAEAEANEETRTPQSPKLSLESGSGSGSGAEGETSENVHHTPQQSRSRAPITADETQIAVELIFAVINELYTLSSAWNIRRTLLNAAKTYILRPGSPTLDTIRDLLQDSMIESHTSDDALGEYIKKLRENALPTEEELAAWPAPPTEEEKTQLRDKARRLFVQRGIPQALTSVMGAAASREALEKIFDSLQVETVARGFVFSVMLQGLRVLTL